VDRTLCDSIDLDDLRSRALSAENSNRLSSHDEDVRKKMNQFFVRCAIDGRGRETNLERFAMHAGDFSS